MVLLPITVTLLALALLAWAFNHSVVISYARPSDTVTGTVPKTGNVEIAGSFSVANGVSNQQELMAWINANLLSIMLMSDQNVTLKTNNSGAPQDTISLIAGVPTVYTAGGPVANPFAGNVTTTFWSNSSGNTANVNVRGLASN